MTNFEKHIAAASDRVLGSFLGEMAECELADACEYCPAREQCDPYNVLEDCTHTFTRWLEETRPDGTTNGDWFRGMSPDEAADWIGEHLAQYIGDAGACDGCPAQEICAAGDFESCAAAWKAWLKLEADGEEEAERDE